MHSIHIQLQGRVVHVLRNVNLSDAGQLADASRQLLRGIVGDVEIACVDLNVNRSRHAGIENCVHHGAALKERADVRKFGR